MLSLPSTYPFSALQGWLVGLTWRGFETWGQVRWLCWCRSCLKLDAQGAAVACTLITFIVASLRQPATSTALTTCCPLLGMCRCLLATGGWCRATGCVPRYSEGTSLRCDRCTAAAAALIILIILLGRHVATARGSYDGASDCQFLDGVSWIHTTKCKRSSNSWAVVWGIPRDERPALWRLSAPLVVAGSLRTQMRRRESSFFNH